MKKLRWGPQETSQGCLAGQRLSRQGLRPSGSRAQAPNLSIAGKHNNSSPLHFSACSRRTVSSAMYSVSDCHKQQCHGHCLRAPTVTLDEALPKTDHSSWPPFPVLGLNCRYQLGLVHNTSQYSDLNLNLNPGGLAVSPPAQEAPSRDAAARLACQQQGSSELKVKVSESQDYRLYTHSNLLL